VESVWSSLDDFVLEIVSDLYTLSLAPTILIARITPICTRRKKAQTSKSEWIIQLLQ
jgi:hypothetical protein